MYDLAIIGGGPGGYVAAIRGAQHGLKVLLVEKDSLGGTCLNRGCIPTKCFIHDAKLLEAAKHSPVMTGVENLAMDLNKMVTRKAKVVKDLVSGLASVIQSHGIDVAQGLGELTAPGRIRVKRSDGTVVEHEAHNVILATGSRPTVPSSIQVDGRMVQTTDEALEPEDLPRRLIIIGGGVIGMEFAAIYHYLGCTVTIMEMLPDILINEDAEIRRGMHMVLKKRGLEVLVQAAVQEVDYQGETVQVTYKGEDGSVNTLAADRVLVATGRAPVLDGIDAQALGLKTDGPFIKVNARLETNLRGVYAIGDLVGGMMLAHKASAEAEAAVTNIAGGNKEIRQELIPRCIWGFSEIGSVGLTEEEARAAGKPIHVGKFPYQFNGHAMAMGDVDGFVKIVAHSETGEILGVHILGAHATELIGEPVVAMAMEAAVEDLAEAIRPHPTLSEMVMEAAMDWNSLAIHAPKRP